MPDGSLNVTDAACARMHDRLGAWGRLILSGGSGPRQKWPSDDEREFFDYKPRDYDDAQSMSGLVLQLPKRQQSLVLAAFYLSDKVWSVWHELGEHRKALISEDIARTVNKNIARLNRDAGTDLMPIFAHDVDAIRLRAIRMLVERERICG